jgi:hypothetical protein
MDRGVVVPIAAGDGTLHELSGDVQARVDGLRRRIRDLQPQRASKKTYGRAWRSLSKQIKRAHCKAANVTDQQLPLRVRDVRRVAHVLARTGARSILRRNGPQPLSPGLRPFRGWRKPFRYGVGWVDI